MSTDPNSSDECKLTCQVAVTNGLGLHARVAARIAETVSRYNCQVVLAKDGQEAEADSVLSLLTLDAPVGSTITVTAWGQEASAVLDEINRMFVSGFGERE